MLNRATPRDSLKVARNQRSVPTAGSPTRLPSNRVASHIGTRDTRP